MKQKVGANKLKDFIGRHTTAIEWLTGSATVVVAIIAWLINTNLATITLYDIFPPLGLIAFGLMWSHFVIGALRRYAGSGRRPRDHYMVISMGLVLALLILHPGLLWFALFKDGYGLPPVSYMEVYATQLMFILLGTVGLLIFLAYELKRFFGTKKWWRYVEIIQSIGMGVIFVHAIGLGGELRLNWFMGLWLFYGTSLVAAVIYSNIIYKPRKGMDGTK